MRGPSFVLASILFAALIQPAQAQYVVIDDAGHVLGKRPERRGDPPYGGSTLSLDPACGLFPVAWHGEPVPGGGTLSPSAQGTPIALNAAGQAAFYSRIDGSLRNQGIFIADAAGLQPIAIGCGGYLGSGDPGTACGDPTPIGGKFTGFYPGSALPPTINDEGDALFLADVFGGASSRGLFLYRKAAGGIVKVAAIGDATPAGVLAAVGVGSLNNHGEVVFLGSVGPSNEQSMILHWADGVIKVIVRPGDEVPGGTVHSLVWIGFNAADGTYIPVIEVPDINDSGAISFHAVLESGVGLYVSRDGVHELYVITGQPSPAGGAFINLYAPILNEAGEIAFEGEYEIDPWTVGWFVGRPGKWRKVLSFYDSILGGQAWGIAVSHNPQQPLDDEGNLILWSDVRFDDGTDIDAVHIGYADGTLETIAKTGDPSPLGGTLRELHAWPTLASRRCSLGASLLGVTTYSAHLEFLKRPLQVNGLSVGAPDPVSGAFSLTWDAQSLAPADGSPAHDVLRGVLGGFGQPAECAVEDLPGTDWTEPAAGCPAGAGEGCWYLVRVEDSCGRGSYGAEGAVCLDPCDGVPIPGCPVCGNQQIEGSEECDGVDLGGETCVSQWYDSGTLGCSAACTLDRTGCTTICGNGIIRGDEECDGVDLAGRRCALLGFDGGILTCTSSCTFDLSGCCCTDGTPGCPACPVCGNGVREAPFELCDGADTGTETCRSQGRLYGVLGCTATCDRFDYTGCIGL